MCSHCIDTVLVKSKPPNNYIIIDVSIIIYTLQKNATNLKMLLFRLI